MTEPKPERLSIETIKHNLSLEFWHSGSEWSPDCDDTIECRWLYIGSVFHLYPSGKYYLPFACSNVELCPACNGSGNDTSISSFIAGARRAIRYTITRTYHTVQRRAWSLRVYRNLFRWRVCPACGGLGSMEAWHDQLWREQAELDLESIDCCLECGEGDPCDLFIVEYRGRE